MKTQPTSKYHPEPLLTEFEACEFLRIRPRQLLTWRTQGRLPFIRISRSIRYRRCDLEAALDAMTEGGFALNASVSSADQKNTKAAGQS
jgi:predicted site-specific integrase-resolvase